MLSRQKTIQNNIHYEQLGINNIYFYRNLQVVLFY